MKSADTKYLYVSQIHSTSFGCINVLLDTSDSRQKYIFAQAELHKFRRHSYG